MKFGLTRAQIVEDIAFLHQTISDNNPLKFLKQRTHGVDWDDSGLRDGYIARAGRVRTATGFLQLVNAICRDTRCGHIYPNPGFIVNLHKKDFESEGSPWRLAVDDELNYERNLYWKKLVNFWLKVLAIPGKFRGKGLAGVEAAHDVALDDKTLYVRLPVMYQLDDEKTAWLSKIAASLNEYDNLIIDIRGNPGGGDGIWRELLCKIINRDLVTPMILCVRAGEHIRPYYEILAEGADDDELDKYIKSNGITFPAEVVTDAFRKPIFNNEVINPNEDSARYGGKIAVIVSRHNYSSSEAFLVRVAHNKLATLVGEATGGDGIGCTPACCILPNSKLNVIYPVVMGLNPDGTINDEHPIAPDIECEVPMFERPVHMYTDGGREVLLADIAVRTALDALAK